MIMSTDSLRARITLRALTPLALAAAAGLTVTAAAPAQAQKEEKPAAPAKASYSKEFVAAYKAYEALSKAATPDVAAMTAALPGLMAASKTPDDRYVTGQAYVAAGNAAKDPALQLQGVDLMLQSGKVEPARAGSMSLIGGQLAYNAKDYAKARTYLAKAVELGVTEGEPLALLAETYFAQNDSAGGLKVLTDAIAARKAAGQPISEAWIKRGLSHAYNSKQNEEARKWALLYAREFPHQTSWGDAVAIAINTSNYQPQEMLDLLRLARKTNTLKTRSMYLEYVDAADPRKLPSEVVSVLDAGVAAKLVDNNVQMVRDARATAVARLAADKAELPSLQRDASAAGAKLVTVMAAADTLLSYGRYADAEALYAKAAGMAGANLPLVLTRQGIAQVEQGKYAEAQATFAKVQGARQPIANLWALYAQQKASGTVIGPAPGGAQAVSS
jgi:tetratricopeptide (TPR) repeat protein